MYPEYHKVYQMMQYPSGYEGYKSLEQHVIVEILPDKRVKLAGPHSCGVIKVRMPIPTSIQNATRTLVFICFITFIFQVSCVVICIGAHPDLSFLGDIQYNLGVQPGLAINCKRNPMAINFATHECVRQPGLFALGPLVGENFVRFLQGGALAVTNYLANQKISHTMTK